MQTPEVSPLGLAQVELGEQAPDRQTAVAYEGLLELAEPPQEQRQPAPGDAVGEQKIEVLVLHESRDYRAQLHDAVIQLQYGCGREVS